MGCSYIGSRSCGHICLVNEGMIMKNKLYILLLASFYWVGCGKKDAADPPVTPIPRQITLQGVTVNTTAFANTLYGVNRQPAITITFNEPVMQSTVALAVKLTEPGSGNVLADITYQKNDSVVVLKPKLGLKALSKYKLQVTTDLKSNKNINLVTPFDQDFITQIDSSRKFPVISDNALLDLVQHQTFRYFWDFGHPVSGLARERDTDTDICTSGGSGFGIMAIITGVNRNFITRGQALARMQTMVAFLKNTAETFRGAYPHWLNGATGKVIPFSARDNGADLVETSYLMQGLLCARQYFNDAGTAETLLRADINAIFNKVEWNWFRQNNQNVLYWHWSANFNWDMNMPIRGWNECLITYVMAASSTTFGIPKEVYTNGWAGSSGFINGNSYFGYQLPLGPPLGGPLFFEHYSFLGINPNGLTDVYANYADQTRNHTFINYNYCKQNPKSFYGYSDSVWGLTASDIPNGYAASSPTNDLGVIAPTAAISSLPYTPVESMAALKFFYYVLGDKIWKQYGFTDAFSLKELWFSPGYLAIDQGPIIVMIENYRSGLLWDLFTSCPEVKAGMKNLGFIAPYL
jgi:hypothetical protein